MSKVRHVLGISGGKDSAALAIYLKDLYPQLDLEYYFCDTGKELAETYRVIDNLQIYLGKKIQILKAAEGSSQSPFDYFYHLYGGFLPSSNARWCTKNIKLQPFEQFVGDDPVISYVAIRGDEDRDGYISKKSNIQSIFPFRHNIWSEDIIAQVLDNRNISIVSNLYKKISKDRTKLTLALKIMQREMSPDFNRRQKLNELLSMGIPEFNQTVFQFLKSTDYPLSKLDNFPLLDNKDSKVRDDIFSILRESGVGVPSYYEKIEFQVNGKTGHYARTRSGCFFCFFQRKIEWVWLYEQHPTLFQQAQAYEKEGFTWMDNESLEELSNPQRIAQIKEDHIKKSQQSTSTTSPYLIDILQQSEEEGCAACFL